MDRIIKRIDLSSEELNKVLWAFGLTRNGGISAVCNGRIANNILVETKEAGDVIVRAYPYTYGHAKVKFEVDVLQHLSKKGCKVPHPKLLLREVTGHQSILSSFGLEIFIYEALTGSTISQSELSVQLAAGAGNALANLIPHASSFVPSDLAPQGDLGFIAGLLRAAKERDERLALSPATSEMELILSDAQLARALKSSFSGVVHADYFFENVLADETRSEICGIIDFGDSYIGYLINDILIGAMEFAVFEDENWDLDCFNAFLRANKVWICRQNIPPVLAKKILLANCIRFAIYTLPFSNAEGLPVEKNKYVARFIKILESDLGRDLESCWRSNS